MTVRFKHHTNWPDIEKYVGREFRTPAAPEESHYWRAMNTTVVHEIEWFDTTKAASSALVSSVEKQLGVTFPDAYRQLVQTFQQGIPVTRSRFVFSDHVIGQRSSGIGWMLPLIEQDNEPSIIETVNDPPEGFPARAIPFAGAGSGNSICFDYRARNHDPSVVFWNHGYVEEESLAPIADSFVGFLAMLVEEQC